MLKNYVARNVFKSIMLFTKYCGIFIKIYIDSTKIMTQANTQNSRSRLCVN